MTFEVPEANASKEQDKFQFKIPGQSGTFAVKRLKFLSVAQAEQIESDGEALFEFFGKKGTKQGDALRSLNRGQYQALIRAWQQDSDVDLGESAASSAS